MPGEPSNRPVIANTTPLVALWSVGRLDLLRSLYGKVLIPQAVREEFLAVESVLRQAALETATWIETAALADSRRTRVYVGLDRGESEVLALAEERTARLVIIDELRGRRYARRLEIPLTGTLGVLLLAKERGLVVAVKPLMDALLEAGLYLSPVLVERVCLMARE